MRVSPIFKARDPSTYPTEYSSDDWHRAISMNFSHYVPHIPKNILEIPDTPNELRKKTESAVKVFNKLCIDLIATKPAPIPIAKGKK